MADDRTLSPSLRRETDLLIIDYLVYTATATLLRVAHERVAHERVAGSGSDGKPIRRDVPEDLLLQLQLVECEYMIIPRIVQTRGKPKTRTEGNENVHLLR